MMDGLPHVIRQDEIIVRKRFNIDTCLLWSPSDLVHPLFPLSFRLSVLPLHCPPLSPSLLKFSPSLKVVNSLSLSHISVTSAREEVRVHGDPPASAVLPPDRLIDSNQDRAPLPPPPPPVRTNWSVGRVSACAFMYYFLCHF